MKQVDSVFDRMKKFYIEIPNSISIRKFKASKRTSIIISISDKYLQIWMNAVEQIAVDLNGKLTLHDIQSHQRLSLMRECDILQENTRIIFNSRLGRYDIKLSNKEFGFVYRFYKSCCVESNQMDADIVIESQHKPLEVFFSYISE